MSYLATAWASMSAPVADVNEFAVLMMLAEKAGADGCSAFPSRPTIAKRTKIDGRTVLRALARLEERRVIAKGDQRAAAYLRADRRPIVWDLLIPASWYSAPQIAEVNDDREQRGLPPLTSKNRPDIAPAPDKKRRTDTDKPCPQRRRKKERGDTETPREPDPARGVSETGTGCLEDTDGVSSRHPREVLDPVHESSSAGAREAQTDDDQDQEQEHGTAAPSLPAARQHADGDAADFVAELPGMDRKGPRTRARLHQPTAQALAAGWTPPTLAAHLRREVNPSKCRDAVAVYAAALADLPAPPAPSSPAAPPPPGRCPEHPHLSADCCALCDMPSSPADRRAAASA